jgi:hypothetical protein
MKKNYLLILLLVTSTSYAQKTKKYFVSFSYSPALSFFAADAPLFGQLDYGYKKNMVGNCYSFELSKQTKNNITLNLYIDKFLFSKRFKETNEYPTAEIAIDGKLYRKETYVGFDVGKIINLKKQSIEISGGINFQYLNTQYYTVGQGIIFRNPPVRGAYATLYEFKSTEFGVAVVAKYHVALNSYLALSFGVKAYYLVSVTTFDILKPFIALRVKL